MTGFFEDHLNLDTVVAFVDGELSMTAYQRAAAHLMQCPMCAGEVAEQASARESLRAAPAPRMPGSLAAALCSIPVALPIASASPGVGIDTRTGYAIRVSHVSRDGNRSRRFRIGAGALVAGIAVGALATTGSGPADDPVLQPQDVARTVEPISATLTPRPIGDPVMLVVPVPSTTPTASSALATALSGR